MDNDKKQAAFDFLTQFTQHLNHSLPPWGELNAAIPLIVEEAKTRDDWKHKRQPEDAFLYHYAFPLISEFLIAQGGLTKAQAREALLTEYYRQETELSSGTPSRSMKSGHPFGKQFASPQDIYEKWSGNRGAKLTQLCPDLALRQPSPHSVVFEGKYYPRGGQQAGATTLVSSAYQAFVYQALPHSEANSNGVPWDYDFACLLALDTSPEGTLLSAFQSLPDEVRQGFWDGANIFVAIVRPGG